MYRVIQSSNFWGYNYRYEVHWISPDGRDCLLGAFNNIEDAEKSAIKQIQDMMENPWETKTRKAHFIMNCYIYDSENNRDVTTSKLEDIEDEMISELGVEI